MQHGIPARLRKLKAEFAEQRRGFEDGQAHDAAMAAVDALDEDAGLALDAVGAGLVEGLAAGQVAFDVLFAERAEEYIGDRGLEPYLVVPRTATLVIAWWLRPEKARSMRRASSAFSGLPKISPSIATVVSAASKGRDGRPQDITTCQPASALDSASRSV